MLHESRKTLLGSFPPFKGCISANPRFVGGGDFHLQSTAGHWTSAGWVLDSATSPCIDAGDPASDFSLEPAPNGSRINMGAYGGTAQASKSYAPPAPTVLSIDPASCLDNTSAAVTITGTGFRSNATAKLAKTGLPDIVGTGLTVVSDTTITCTFDCNGVALGFRDVVVTNTDLQSGTLANGFEVRNHDTSPPTINSWAVVATHTGVGDVAVPAADEYIESRNAGLKRIRVVFSEPMNQSSAGPGAVNIRGLLGGDRSSLVTTLTWSDSTTVIIGLSAALPDQDAYKVTLGTAFEDLAGNALSGDVDRVLAALKSDVNSANGVNGTDSRVEQTKMGLLIDATTARYDVNTSGHIDGTDSRIIQTNMGHTLPLKPWVW